MRVSFCVLVLGLASTGWGKENEIEIRRDVPSSLLYPLAGHTPFGIHRGTPYWLEVLTAGATRFDRPRDLAVTRLRSTDSAKDDWDDVLVSVYGVNSGRGEIIYNVGNNKLKVFGRPGNRPGEFQAPLGIAASPEGRVLVADTGNARIQELKDDGKGLSFVRILGQGLGLVAPSFLALDGAGGLFVSDTGSGLLLHLDREGDHPRKLWSGPGKPLGLAYAEPAQEWFFPDQAMLVLSVEEPRGWALLRLDPESGRVLARTSLPEGGGPFAALELDYQGNSWIVDSGLCRILKYSPDLEFLDSLGGRGEGDYRFAEPYGLAIWRRFGQVFVSEKEGAHYFWVGADAKEAKLELGRDGAEVVLSFLLTERAFVSAAWVQGQGKKQVRTEILPPLEMLEGRQNRVLPAAPGPGARLELRLMATYSTRERIAKEISLDQPGARLGP